MKSEKKRICILTYSLGGGGAERTVANLLNSLNRNKYDIHLVLMNTLIEYSIPADQKICYIEKSDRFESDYWKLLKLPYLAWRFAGYCKENNIDLVFAVMNRPNMVATLAKYFGLKAPVAISEQFYTPFLYKKNSLAGKFKCWLLTKLYNKADCILPNSAGTKEALISDFNIHTRFEVVKNPTDISTIKKMAAAMPDVKVDFSRFTFVNVATFRMEKNHHLLIDSANELRELDFQLLLIGKGSMLEMYKQKVKELQLEEKIKFIYYTDNPFAYLSRAQCFLLSSFGEGFPNILIESMVCGLPIISVDCKTGPRELLAPDTAFDTQMTAGSFEKALFGILTAYNSKQAMVEAMKWALQNKEQLAAYSNPIKLKAEEFEIQKVTTEFEEIFDSLLT